MSQYVTSQSRSDLNPENKTIDRETIEKIMADTPVRLWKRYKDKDARDFECSDVFIYIQGSAIVLVGVDESEKSIYRAEVATDFGQGPSFQGTEASPDGAFAKSCYENLVNQDSSLINKFFRKLR